METPSDTVGELAASGKRLSRSLLALLGNRLELFGIEVQEARQSMLRLLLIALGVAACALLSDMALSAAVVLWCWNLSPVCVLTGVALAHALLGLWLYRKLAHGLQHWEALPETLEQLRKDRQCLDQSLQ
ncbi:MAG TPA: hypothetical protein DCM86_07170 [Verrucomicrobiales bacterium]|nr:hypothetical protein [Verrucomicrobiales bacterium]